MKSVEYEIWNYWLKSWLWSSLSSSIKAKWVQQYTKICIYLIQFCCWKLRRTWVLIFSMLIFFFKLQFGKHNVVQRSLVAYSSWGNNESDMTATFTSLFFPSLYIQGTLKTITYYKSILTYLKHFGIASRLHNFNYFVPSLNVCLSPLPISFLSTCQIPAQ